MELDANKGLSLESSECYGWTEGYWMMEHWAVTTSLRLVQIRDLYVIVVYVCIFRVA